MRLSRRRKKLERKRLGQWWAAQERATAEYESRLEEGRRQDAEIAFADDESPPRTWVRSSRLEPDPARLVIGTAYSDARTDWLSIVGNVPRGRETRPGEPHRETGGAFALAPSMDIETKLFLARRELVRARLKWDGSPRAELRRWVAQRLRECVEELKKRLSSPAAAPGGATAFTVSAADTYESRNTSFRNPRRE